MLLLTVTLATHATAWAQDPVPAERQRLVVAGNDEILWLIVGQYDEQERGLINRFAIQDKTSPRPRQAAHLLPQRGSIVRAAAVGDELHVFFGRDGKFGAEGAHYQYSRSAGGRSDGGARREMMLPGPIMPAAVASEPGQVKAMLWAIVDGATAQQVHQQWRQRNQSTKPDAQAPDTAAETQPAEGPTAALDSDIDTSLHHLVAYEQSTWRPGPAAPAESRDASRFWLACGEGQSHLFWQSDAQSREVHYARHADGEWVVGPAIVLDSPLTAAAALVANRQVVFASLTPHPSVEQALRCTPWVWQSGEEQAGGWRAAANLHAPDGSADEPLALPADCALGGFLDKLVIMRTGPDGVQVACHSAIAGGPPDEPWRNVPLVEHKPMSRSQRTLRDFAATMVVALVLVLVFWRRQESIASPVLLPVGFGLAGPMKRAVGGLIDLLPALAVTAFLWGYANAEALNEFANLLRQWYATATTRQMDPPEPLPWPPSLPWAWLACRVIYVLYCTAFEVTGRATPGKRLLGCEVRTETLEQPNAVQIFIRNITRLIELEPYLQVWPFMLVVFFTRNNQRVGDLLARTIVIERQGTPDDAPNPDPPPDDPS
ncbi:MAG: RDD family protein [Phycisphaerae bacterium]|nr:RDD family protein [Phycisphaerae bacterium]